MFDPAGFIVNSMKHLFSCFMIILVSNLALAGEQERPNILLLMAEDLSSRIGSFGDPVAITPNIDALAEQGVRYTNAFTTAGVCAPSRTAIITGLHQISVGGQHMRTSTRPAGGYLAVPPADVKAFPELLRAAGYFTYTDQKLDYQFSGTFVGTGPSTIWDREGNEFSWRDRQPGQPFFAYRNFLITHESGVFKPLGNWPNSLTHLIMQLLRYWQGLKTGVGPVTPEQVEVPPYYPDTPMVRSDITRHYNNIYQMDRQVGEILAQLKADNLLDSTIVIWTTDHGDGLPRAKRDLYDSGIKVPMVIYWPETYKPDHIQSGSLDNQLISFVDLAPAILAMAGVKVPGAMQGNNFTDDSINERMYVFASRDRIDEVYDRQRAVRDNRYKYIRSWYPLQENGHRLKFRDNLEMMKEMWAMRDTGKLDKIQNLWFEAPGVEQLYDTLKDPYEINNLISDQDYQQVLDRLQNALTDWQGRVEDWSETDENDMVAGFQPKGETPITEPPILKLNSGKIVIEAVSHGSSMAYRVDEDPWQLYTAPLDVSGAHTIIAKAVRYGWEESEEVQLKVQINVSDNKQTE
jgi:arylsulfatase A-like enzyme